MYVPTFVNTLILNRQSAGIQSLYRACIYDMQTIVKTYVPLFIAYKNMHISMMDCNLLRHALEL